MIATPVFHVCNETFGWRKTLAVLIAAGANIAGMAMALTMPRRGWREGG